MLLCEKTINQHLEYMKILSETFLKPLIHSKNECLLRKEVIPEWFAKEYEGVMTKFSRVEQ